VHYVGGRLELAQEEEQPARPDANRHSGRSRLESASWPARVASHPATAYSSAAARRAGSASVVVLVTELTAGSRDRRLTAAFGTALFAVGALGVLLACCFAFGPAGLHGTFTDAAARGLRAQASGGRRGAIRGRARRRGAG
jgi:hypothetical protein